MRFNWGAGILCETKSQIQELLDICAAYGYKPLIKNFIEAIESVPRWISIRKTHEGKGVFYCVSPNFLNKKDYKRSLKHYYEAPNNKVLCRKFSPDNVRYVIAALKFREFRNLI